MNILEQEDIIKGLPDQALMKEASAPSGEVPPFLVVSEIKRRNDMRKRYESQQQQNQGTVKDQILSEAMGGIAGMMPPQMAPQQLAMAPMGAPSMGGMPPQGMPPMAPPQPPMGGISSIPQGMPPMGMAQGGIVQMAGGGSTDLLTLIAAGASPVELLRRGYTQEQIEATSAEYQAKMSAPAEVLRGMQQVQQAPTGTPRMGYGDQYDPPFIRGITDVIADKASDLADSVGRGMDSFGIEAEKNMPNYGLLYGENDLSLPSFEGANPYGLGDVARYGKKGITSIANLEFGDGPYGLPREVGVGIESLFGGAASGAQVQGRTSAEVQPASNASTGKAFDFFESPFPYYEGKGTQADGTEPSELASAVDLLAGLKIPSRQRASASDDDLFDGAISSIDSRLADLYAKETQASPVLDLSDVIERSRKGTLSELAMRLGAGVAAGDVSKGIAGAADAAARGRQEMSKLEMAERIATTKAGQEDIRRGEQRDLDLSRLGLQREQLQILSTRYQNELSKAASVGRNELFRTASSIVEAVMGESATLTVAERKEQVNNLMNEFLTMYAPSFGVTDLPKMPAGGSGAKTVSFGDMATTPKG